MYTWRESRAKAYARKQLGCRRRAAAAASRSARAAAFPSRATILSETSSPVCSSRASQTDPEPPLPRGRSGRYLLRTSPAPSSATAAFVMGLTRWPPEGCFLSGRTPEYSLARAADGMSTHGDDNIEFDFFDEPETVETTQRRRLP